MGFVYNLLNIIRWAMSAYILVVIASALITWVNPDPKNPIVQFLRRVTEPVYYWIKRRIPTYFGGVDIAPMILIFGIVFIQQVVIDGAEAMLRGESAMILPVLVIGFIMSVLNAYMWIVIIAAVVSWINPDPGNFLVRALFSLTEPVLYRIRRLIPVNLGGLDISPMVLIIAILFIQHVVLTGVIRLLVG